MRQEADEEVVLDHPHRQLVEQPVVTRHRLASHRTTTWWLADRNSESALELDELLAEADALVVAQVVLEEQHLVDPLDALDRLEQLEHVGRVEVGVERPAGAVGAAGQRVEVAVQRGQRPLAHERRRAGRAGPSSRAATVTPW